jgi:hypothetical protein
MGADFGHVLRVDVRGALSQCLHQGFVQLSQFTVEFRRADATAE